MFSHYTSLADITSQGEPMMDAHPHVFPLSFLADITIGSQGEPMMDALPHVFPLYFPDGDYHRISRRTDGVSGKGYVWAFFSARDTSCGGDVRDGRGTGYAWTIFASS